MPLLGYCSLSLSKQNERLLVFEYLPNGNLRDSLDGQKHLNWDTRVAIALGAARGLEYLHEAAAPRILHRDVKSTNILLDENWKAKVRIFPDKLFSLNFTCAPSNKTVENLTINKCCTTAPVLFLHTVP